MDVQEFDVLARLPEGAAPAQVPEMLQAMLAERFKLAIHREKRTYEVYGLLVGKNGPKLQAAAPATSPTDPAAIIAAGPTGVYRASVRASGALHFQAERMTLANLAELLTNFMDVPVVDMTEIKGAYRIGLDISRADLFGRLARLGGAATTSSDASLRPGDAASAPVGSSVFAAVGRLGFKLEPRKAPIDTIVVDHLERMPTEN